MANEIKITITEKGTAKKYTRRMKAADKATDRFRLKTSGLTRTIGALRNKLLLVTFATALLTAGFIKTVKAAGDAQETISKFEAVFKTQAKAARTFAEDLAKSTNRATIELIDFLSTLQDTFVPLGFTRKAASDLSKDLVTLAVDVASFNNKLDADVIRDFQSALVGNTETVRKYGIVITQAVLGQELLNTGVADSVLKATEAEKAFARYNIILRSTTDAQGDAVRTADSFNNKMKGAQAAALDLSIAIGNQLLPVANKLAGAFTTAARGLTTFFNAFAPAKNATEALEKLKKQIIINAFVSGKSFKALMKDNAAAIRILEARIKAEELFASLAEDIEIESAEARIIRLATEAKAFRSMMEEKAQIVAEFANLSSQISNEIAQREFNNIDFVERKDLQAANAKRTRLIAFAKKNITDSKQLAARLAIIEQDFQTDVTGIQEEADNERAAIRKRLKPFLIAEALANTAVAFTKALPNIPLAIAVGVLGAAQVATIAAQQFAQGGFTSGKTVSVGEGGQEFIKPPAGSQVFTNAQSRQMSNQPQTINLIINDEVIASAIIPALERGSLLGGNNIALT